LDFKITEQIAELFEYFARLFCIVLPCIAWRNTIYKRNRVRYIPTKYH